VGCKTCCRWQRRIKDIECSEAETETDIEHGGPEEDGGRGEENVGGAKKGRLE
jgi:hypothetical protein